MTCSLPRCRETALVQLRAVDGLFWFCAEHAEKYAQLGYEHVGEAA